MSLRSRFVSSLALLLGCTFGISSSAHGAFSFVFVESGPFDGDTAAPGNNTAGPFLDTATGVSATLTTTALTAGTVLNEQGGLLGSGTDTIGADGFGADEFWSFTFDAPSQLTAIDLSSYGVDDSLFIQSPAFVGAAITPGTTKVTLTSSTGTFTFKADVAGDAFGATSFYGTSTIPQIPAGTNINVTVGSTGGASFQGLTFNLIATVPEPGTLTLLAAGALLALRRRAQMH